jgi:hypothetical protein
MFYSNNRPFTLTTPLRVADMPDSEREYVDLLYRASKKYANWDPEIAVEVGDWGRITTGRTGLAFWRRERGTFLKEGNIYKDGKAEKYGIPPPQEFGLDATDGVTWIVSENVQDCDFRAAAGGYVPMMTSGPRISFNPSNYREIPIFAKCKVKAGFKVSSGRGAVLVMDNDVISAIDPPGSLRRLLDERDMRDCVIVSQTHRCSSYARLLTAEGGQSVVIGLSIQPPVSGVISARGDVGWVHNSKAGNFRAKVNESGQRDFYPLFKLVSLTDKNTSSGVRGELEDGDPPLPDAIPPWLTETEADVGTEKVSDMSFRPKYHS